MPEQQNVGKTGRKTVILMAGTPEEKEQKKK
jgi:hypothetical protein